MKTQLSLFSALALALAGCNSVAEAPPSAHFGESVMHNIAVQTVNPDAPDDKGPIEYNGHRQGLAQGRYLNDKVKQPAEAQTLKSTSQKGDNNEGNAGASAGTSN